MNRSVSNGGFTLVEVLIALAITAFVSAIAYTSFSTVLSGVESSQVTAERVYQLNRAWMMISRDLEQFVARPVRDEFGELEPASSGRDRCALPAEFYPGRLAQSGGPCPI